MSLKRSLLVLFALVACASGSSAVVDGVWSPSFAPPQPCSQTDDTCNAVLYQNLTTDIGLVDYLQYLSSMLITTAYQLDQTYNSLTVNSTYLYQVVDPGWKTTVHDGLSKIIVNFYNDVAEDLMAREAGLVQLVVLIQQTANEVGDQFMADADHAAQKISDAIAAAVTSLSSNTASLATTMYTVYNQANDALASTTSKVENPIDALLSSLVSQQYTLNTTYADTMNQLNTISTKLSGLASALDAALQVYVQNATNEATYFKGTYTNSLVQSASQAFQQIVNNDEAQAQNAYMAILGPTDGVTLPAQGTLAYSIQNNTVSRTQSSQAVDGNATVSLGVINQALYSLLAVNQSVFQPLVQDLTNISASYMTADGLFHNQTQAAIASELALANSSIALMNQTQTQVNNALTQTSQILTGSTASLSNQFLTLLASVALSQSNLINQLQQQMISAQSSTLGSDSSRVAAVTGAFANAASYLSSSAQAGVNQMTNANAMLTLSQSDIQSIANLFSQFAQAGLATNNKNLDASMTSLNGQMNTTTSNANTYTSALVAQQRGAVGSSTTGMTQIANGLISSANSSNSQSNNLMSAAYSQAGTTYNTSMNQLGSVLAGILASASQASKTGQAAAAAANTSQVMTGYVNSLIANGTSLLNSALSTANSNITQGANNVTASVVASGMQMVSALTAAASQVSQVGTNAAYAYGQNMSYLQSLFGGSLGNMTALLTTSQPVVDTMNGQLADATSETTKTLSAIMSNATSFERAALTSYQSVINAAINGAVGGLAQKIDSTMTPLNTSIYQQISNLESSITNLQQQLSGLSSLVSSGSTYGGAVSAESKQLLATFGTQLDSLQSQMENVIDAATKEAELFENALSSTNNSVVQPQLQTSTTQVNDASNTLSNSLSSYSKSLSGLFMDAMRKYNASTTAYLAATSQMLSDAQNQVNAIEKADMDALNGGKNQVAQIIDPVALQIYALNSSTPFADQVERMQQLLAMTSPSNTSAFDASVLAADSAHDSAVQTLQDLETQSQQVIAQGLQAINDNAGTAADAADNATTTISGNADQLYWTAGQLSDYANDAATNSTNDANAAAQNMQDVLNSANDAVAINGDQLEQLLSAFAAQQEMTKGLSLNITSNYSSVATVNAANQIWSDLRASAVNFTQTSTDSLNEMVGAVADFSGNYTEDSVGVPATAMNASEYRIKAILDEVNANVTLNGGMVTNIKTQVDDLMNQADTENNDFNTAMNNLNVTAVSYVNKLRARAQAISALATTFASKISTAASNDLLALVQS